MVSGIASKGQRSPGGQDWGRDSKKDLFGKEWGCIAYSPGVLRLGPESLMSGGPAGLPG